MRGGFSSNVWTRWKAISCWSRISASPPFAATTHVISGTTPWTISDILHVQRQPPSLTHSTGRDKEKALQQKSLQSLIFTQSGRRDLNPRPPEPHSGALPGCATSRNTRRVDAETPRRPGKATARTEHRLPPTLPLTPASRLGV